MFTGLIEATGRVDAVEAQGNARRMRIGTALGDELHSGDSVAVNGVCLTVAERSADGFIAVVSPETLRVTTLQSASPGLVVNLERPLKADGRLGGHFVLGHVDGVGRIVEIAPDGACHWLEVELPVALAPLVISKGSIAVDGISLTVARQTGARIGVQIVPHTWTHTALSHARVGDDVNLEMDVIGKYVARLLAGVQQS